MGEVEGQGGRDGGEGRVGGEEWRGAPAKIFAKFRSLRSRNFAKIFAGAPHSTSSHIYMYVYDSRCALGMV